MPSLDGNTTLDRTADADPPLSSSRAKVTLLVTCVGAFMLMLDLTVVNVALPAIRDDFGASFSQLQWVLDSYALGLAVLLVASGSFADRYGRRTTFAWGMALFALASLACGLAPNAGTLTAARLAQGLAGAILFAVGPALLGDAFTGKARAAAFGLFGGIGGLAVAFGPMIGGGLADGLGWEWIFLVNVPVAAVALILTVFYVRESTAEDPPSIDVPGLIAFSAMVATLILAILRGERQGWGSAEILGLFGLTLVLAVVFVLIQLRKRDKALFDTELFSNYTFTGLNLVTFVGNLTVLAVIFLFVTYMQGVLGLSAWETGVRVLPLTIALFVGAAVAGPLSAKLPYKYFFVASQVGIIGGLLLFLRVEAGDSWVASLPLMIVFGFGVGVFNPVRAVLSVSLTKASRTGIASGINETFQQVGVAVGIAGLGAYFQNRAHHAFLADPAVGPLGADAETLAQVVPTGGGNALRQATGGTVPEQIAAAADTAFVDGLHTTFLVAIAIAAVALVLSFIGIRQKDIHPDHQFPQ